MEIWPPGCAACYKFSHQVALLALVAICPPSGATCINLKFGHQVCHLRLSYKFSHQVVPLALVRIFPPCVTTSKETSIPCQPPCHPPCLSPLSSSPYYGITNRQSYISKVLSRYLHSPGSHQSTRFLESVSDSVTHVGSIASHDANNVIIFDHSFSAECGTEQ